MNLHSTLQKIFQNIDLERIEKLDVSNLNKGIIRTIADLFPGWKKIMIKGYESNVKETRRTLQHILRSVKMYYLLLENQYESDLSPSNIASLREDLEHIRENYGDLFLYVLFFHDIGRPFNREWHHLESAKVLEEKHMLKHLNLEMDAENLLMAVIRNHLLLGTIFTGESSYLGAKELLQDHNFKDFGISDEKIQHFFLVLKAFTIIDILGYHYSQIFDHYFKYYQNIVEQLINAFSARLELPKDKGQKRISQRLTTLDAQNLKWRVAGGLRIFQWVSTQPYLTESFYYSKLDQTLERINLDWKTFKNSLERTHSQIQFKYALPIMMVLSSGEFKRAPLTADEQIDLGLFDFWTACCDRVRDLNLNNNFLKKVKRLVYFVFHLPRTWFLDKEIVESVRSEQFFKIIKSEKGSARKNTKRQIINIEIEKGL
ncbi:MAG: hypothetical protein ACOC35_12210 [Promethearchaeia archaeon]